MCTSFLGELMTATHNFGTAPIRAVTTADTFKAALYLTSATVNAATTAYSATSEVSGTGYTAGGVVLTGVTISTSSNGIVYVDFDNAVWNPAAFTARGALIYNASKSNKSVAVLDFGSDKTCQTSFTVQMPENTSTSALLRFN
jgi:hypothetical protein